MQQSCHDRVSQALCASTAQLICPECGDVTSSYQGSILQSLIPAVWTGRERMHRDSRRQYQKPGAEHLVRAQQVKKAKVMVADVYTDQNSIYLINVD